VRVSSVCYKTHFKRIPHFIGIFYNLSTMKLVPRR